MMDSLPNHVILKIFSYLTTNPKNLLSVRQVCRRWKELAELKSLWKDVKVVINNERFDPSTLKIALRCLRVAPVLDTLVLMCCNLTSGFASITKIVEQHPQKIRHLHFGSRSVCDQYLDILRLFSDNLEELTLRFYSSSELNRGLLHLPRLKKLTVLNEPIPAISAQSLPQLRELCIIVKNKYLHEVSALLIRFKLLIRKICVYPSDCCVEFEQLLTLLFDRTLKLGFPELEEIAISVGGFSVCGPVADGASSHILQDCEDCQYLHYLYNCSNSNSNLKTVRLDFGCFEWILKKSWGKKFDEIIIIESKRHCFNRMISAILRMISIILNSFDGVNRVSFKGCEKFVTSNIKVHFLNDFPCIKFDFLVMKRHL